MVKDFSKIPANKRMINNTNNSVIFSIRDKFMMIPVEILPGNALSVKVTTSDDLALLTKQCEELNLTMEVEGPDITDIVVNLTPNIREGESTAEAGATIATLSLQGGTEPVIFSMKGTDAEKFNLADKTITAVDALTEGTYSIIISAKDSTGETYMESVEIQVLGAYPEISEFTITSVDGLLEGNPNVAADAVVANMTANGGTEPYTYALKEDEVNGVDNASFKVDGTTLKVNETPLTVKDYKVAMTVTDSVGKTKDQNVTISVKAPEISALNVAVEEGLTAPLTVDTLVANLTAEGGIAPYTYSIKEENDYADFKVDGTTIKVATQIDSEGTKNITVVVTDKNSKTKEQATEISIAGAGA